MKRVLGLCLALGAVVCAAAEEHHVYNNEDLARVAPFRDQTGVASTPAVDPSAEPAPKAAPRERTRVRGEEYWRKEAEVFERAQRRRRDQIAQLRLQIEHARHPSRSRRGSSAGRARDTSAMEARLALMEARAREEEDRFYDRARRAGALPGWLR